MIRQHVFIYLIGNSEKENEVYKNQIKSSLLNTVVESYTNSWIAFNALRSDAGSGKQPDIILIDYHMLAKNGFSFLEEFKNAEFCSDLRTKLYILSSTKNKELADNKMEIHTNIKTILKPLTEEVIEQLIEF